MRTAWPWRMSLGLLTTILVGCGGSTPSPTRDGVSTDAPPVICPAREGSVVDVASEPDWRQHADYRPWTTADGNCLIRIDVIADRQGPAHCGWQAARVIVTGIPVGARYADDRNDAVYVRDPDDVFDDPATASAFDPDADLPEGAVDTGWRQGDTELWIDPADVTAIYLRLGTSTERWPLDTEPAGCM